MKEWDDIRVRSISRAEMDDLRKHHEPMTERTITLRMSHETWRAMKAAAMSGTMMRFTLATLAGALIGAFIAYKRETRR